MVETLRDLTSPLEGWSRIALDYQRCWARDISGATSAALNPGDLFFDLFLVLTAPVSLVRYPLAWVIKAPRTILPLIAFFAGEEESPGSAYLSIASPSLNSIGRHFVWRLDLVAVSSP